MKGTRVLVVDDEPDVRSLVRELLERGGYDVVEAADGRAGLRAFHESQPELVVLDVTMPELDGWPCGRSNVPTTLRGVLPQTPSQDFSTAPSSTGDSSSTLRWRAAAVRSAVSCSTSITSSF